MGHPENAMPQSIGQTRDRRARRAAVHRRSQGYARIGPTKLTEVPMGVLLVVLVVVAVLLGLVLAWRRAEQQTLTFTEAVRRAEVELRSGAVSFASADGPVRVHRTVRWALAK